MTSLAQQFFAKHLLPQRVIAHEPKKRVDNSFNSICPLDGKPTYVKLEIRADALYSLIKNRVLFVEDIKGLNKHEKQCVKRLLLESLMEAAPCRHQ